MSSERSPQAVISIIMPCYNAEKYLEKSVRSVIAQTYTDWELIITNDGSTDESEKIALDLAADEPRIRVVSKENGGYVSARLHGYKYISKASKYLHFYDADDKLHPRMLELLVEEMEKNEAVGAAYCDHLIMDEKDIVSDKGIDMPRVVPTSLWVKKLEETIKETPFISIFCWTKIIEPMVLIRRIAYEATPGWDISFGKGQGNIGEGVYLFSEIALQWKVHFIDQPLFYYRRHAGQISGVSMVKMQVQANKVLDKWHARINEGFTFRKKIITATIFFKYRLSAYQKWNSLAHELRYHPLKAVQLSASLAYEYFRSLPLIFTYRRLLE